MAIRTLSSVDYNAYSFISVILFIDVMLVVR